MYRKILAGLLVLVLVGCSVPSSNSGSSSGLPPGPAEQPRVLGLLEVKFSGVGDNPTATAQFVRPQQGVSGQSMTVRTDVGLTFTRRAVAFYDDDSTLTRYVQSVFDITNTTASAFANLTLVAVNVPGTTLSGTGVASMSKADGTSIIPAMVLQASPLLTGQDMVRSMKPTNGVRIRPDGAGVEINPELSSLQVFTQTEADTVQTGAAALVPAIVGDVLQYGFVASNPNGRRSIEASGCTVSGCNKGVVTFAYKMPRISPRKDNPFSFTLYFVVTNETSSILTQSLEEQSDNNLAYTRALLLGSSAEIRALGGSTLGGTPINRVCQARTAGTNAAPLAFLVPTGTACAAPAQVDFGIAGFYLVQSTQNLKGNVPLVVGKTAVARAFVTANQAGIASPTVRLTGFVNGVNQGTINLTGPATVPTPASEGSLTQSYNATLPGSWVQPGLEVVLDVDPANSVSESNENNNRLPATGRQSIQVFTVPQWDVTFVPITYLGSTPTIDNTTIPGYMDSILRMYPVNTFTTQVHAAVSFGGDLTTNNGWDQLLNQITDLRTAEGSSRHYIAIVNPQYSSGTAGIGWVGGAQVAVSWAALPSGSNIMAHEVGHNWGRSHSPCSAPGPDPNYPYNGAKLGAFGYDAVAAQVKDPNANVDVMSYCGPVWVSDYTYKGILNFRTGGLSPLSVQGMSAAQDAVLVSGKVYPDGRVEIENVYRLNTRIPAPKAGDFSIRGFDANGQLVFETSLEVMRNHVSPERFFQAIIPLSQLTQLSALQIHDQSGKLRAEMRPGVGSLAAPQAAHATRNGNRVSITWDTSRAKQVMVREVGGEVLGFDSSGSLEVATQSHQLELLYSGLNGGREIVRF